MIPKQMIESKRLMLSALLILSITLIAGGCGDGASDSSGAGTAGGDETNGSDETASLTKSEFIKQADSICKKGSEEVRAEFATYLKENKIKEIGKGGESKAEADARIEEVIEAAIPTLRQQLDGIRALAAPAAIEAQVDAYLAAAEEGIETGEKDPVELFTATGKVLAKSDKLAKEIGFKVCGNR
jgi:uncharacterized Zn finger protein